VDVAPTVSHELLARIALNARNFDEARRQATLTEQADPTLPMVPAVDGALRYIQQDYAGAVAPLQRTVDLMAERTLQLPDINYSLGDSLARLERYNEAERYFLAEVRHCPNNLRARAGLSMLYRVMGRIDASNQVVADLVQRAPTREGYDLAAQLWTMFGETGQAAAMRAAAAKAR